MQGKGRPQQGAPHSEREGWQTLFTQPFLVRGFRTLRSQSHASGQERDSFSTRTENSAVTGSNQRRSAFSPRRRDSRCRKIQSGESRHLRRSSPCTFLVRLGSLLLIGQEILTRPFSFSSQLLSLLL